MKEEVLAAVMFFIRFIEKSDKFPRDQLDNFKRHLTDLLLERFDKHWFPEVPTRGQGYRCIRVNGVSPVDWTLDQAATKCGLSYSDLRLPQELTVWVDPTEVCYRLGESEGSYCTLATFPSECLSLSSSSASSSSCGSESGSSTPVAPCSPPGTPLQDKLLAHHFINGTNRHQHPHHHHQTAISARKVQNKHYNHHNSHQRYNNSSNPMDYASPNKFGRQAPSNIGNGALRVKQSPREMNYYFNQANNASPSSLFLRDRPLLTAPGAFYRNMNYNRNNYGKNVVRV